MRGVQNNFKDGGKESTMLDETRAREYWPCLTDFVPVWRRNNNSKTGTKSREIGAEPKVPA